MKNAVKKIDRALKDLNQVENSQRAENFLVSRSPLHTDLDKPEEYHGALLVRSSGNSSISLGIYFNQNVSMALTKVKEWNPRLWSSEQVKAVTIATEEISHFHYLLSKANAGIQISQLELELQAEIDKFMFLFFALESNREQTEKTFETLYEMLFERFHLKTDLSESEKERYAEANNIAKTFVLKCRKLLDNKDYDNVLKLLRQFYRLGPSEKISLVMRK